MKCDCDRPIKHFTAGRHWCKVCGGELIVLNDGTVLGSNVSKQVDKQEFDPVTRPKHYNSHPSGVEAITITEHYSFCLGNAIKYIWRAGLKGDELEDLKKARWYLDREISRREAEAKKGSG